MCVTYLLLVSSYALQEKKTIMDTSLILCAFSHSQVAPHPPTTATITIPSTATPPFFKHPISPPVAERQSALAG